MEAVSSATAFEPDCEAPLAAKVKKLKRVSMIGDMLSYRPWKLVNMRLLSPDSSASDLVSQSSPVNLVLLKSQNMSHARIVKLTSTAQQSLMDQGEGLTLDSIRAPAHVR